MTAVSISVRQPGLKSGHEADGFQAARGTAMAVKEDAALSAPGVQTFRQNWQTLLTALGATATKGDTKSQLVHPRLDVLSSDPGLADPEMPTLSEGVVLQNVSSGRWDGLKRVSREALSVTPRSAPVLESDPDQAASAHTHRDLHSHHSTRPAVEKRSGGPDLVAQIAADVPFSTALVSAPTPHEGSSVQDVARATEPDDDVKAGGEPERSTRVAIASARESRDERQTAMPIPSSVPSSRTDPQSVTSTAGEHSAESAQNKIEGAASPADRPHLDGSIPEPLSVLPTQKGTHHIQIADNDSSVTNDRGSSSLSNNEAAGGKARGAQSRPAEVSAKESQANTAIERQSSVQTQSGESAQRPRVNEFDAKLAGTIHRPDCTAEHSDRGLVQNALSAVAVTELPNNRPSEVIDARNQDSPRETFAALDAGSGVPRSQWTHVSAQRAEAGFQDSTLGWVSVRAQADPDGGVRATIVPGSPSAAQALGAHLASLNENIAALHPHLHTVTLASPETGWNSQGFDGNTPQQEGSGGQSRRESQSPAQQINYVSHSSSAALPEAPGRTIPSLSADGRSAGVYLSLIA